MRTDVKEKEREREKEREKERRKIRDGKNKSLFLRLLRLRKTEIIMTLSDLQRSVFIIIAFRARRKRRKKNGTKSRTLLICFEAYARERVLYLISAQNTVLRNFVITSPPQNTSNRGRVILSVIITIIAEKGVCQKPPQTPPNTKLQTPRAKEK